MMEDKIKMAFSFAQDVTKQLISLATAVIGLTVTFVNTFSKPSGTLDKWLIGLSWVFLLFSIFFGTWVLLALTGTLEPSQDNGTTISIRGTNVTKPSLAQIALFILGLVLTIAYGVVSTREIPTSVSETQKYLIIENTGKVYCGELISDTSTQSIGLLINNRETVQLNNVKQFVNISTCPEAQ
jgi:hypothetical protein